MNRFFQYSQEQVRSFDLNWSTKDVLYGLSQLTGDLLGSTYAVVAGLVATAGSPASLTIGIGAGEIYQLAAADTSPFGSLPADATLLYQQGSASAQQIVLVTSGLTTGQSQWVLIEAAFAQSDVIRTGDPTAGLLYYYNSANPAQPFQGPGNNGLTQPTVRAGVITLRVVYGTPATTGSEAPPNADSGFVGLYLIDLAYGQTAVNQAAILTAGPSVGTNVPSNYPRAPLLAGLLNAHHGGVPGQAPKINLVTEVQGNLPSANLPVGTKIPLTTSLNLYVNGSTGNDLNNGLTSGTAWKKLQTAINYCKTLDGNGNPITINAAGAFLDGFQLNGPFFNANVTISFAAGSTINDTNTITGTPLCGISNGASISVVGVGAGVTLTTGASPWCFAVIDSSTLIIGGGVNFGAANQYHLYAASGSTIFVNGSYAITGTAFCHANAAYQGQINWQAVGTQAMTITFTATPTFTSTFVAANWLSLVLFNASEVSFSGTFIGYKYSVVANSVLSTNGTPNSYLPGSINGSAATGGQAL